MQMLIDSEWVDAAAGRIDEMRDKARALIAANLGPYGLQAAVFNARSKA